MHLWSGRLVFIVALIGLLGCAHNSSKETSNSNLNPSSAATTEPTLDESVAGELDPGSKLAGVKEIPHETNEHVEKWINFFQGPKGRPLMEKYLSRSTRYLPLMKQILKEEGVPEDLVYVALIESGFSPIAKSRAAAVGYWQFIGGTARRYGLKINSFIDERRDPILATRAAAQYLGGLYKVFNSWYLSMASYNVGENKVKGAVMRHFTRDFWQLAKNRALPRETLEYIPKFLAARQIAENPKQYGFTEIEYEAPIAFTNITIDKPINLKAFAQHIGVDYDIFRRLNPKYRRDIAPVTIGTHDELRVPTDKQEQALAAIEKSTTNLPRIMIVSTDNYKVRRGDSLAGIAIRHGMTLKELRELNDIPRKSRLKVGTILTVSHSEKYNRRMANIEAVKVPTHKVKKNKAVIHIVKKGDTLIDIADRYNVSIRQLAQKNNLSKKAKLYVGAQLVIPNRMVD